MSRSSNDRSHAFFFYVRVLANDLAFAAPVTRIRVLQTSNADVRSPSDNPRIPLRSAEFYSYRFEQKNDVVNETDEDGHA